MSGAAPTPVAGEVMELDPHLRAHLPRENTFDSILRCQGIEHRHVKHRRTVEAEIGGRRYFVKVHRGCGWGEVLKDWLQLRPPIISARTEQQALVRARQLGVRTLTVAGWGERGRAPAGVESFLITEALPGMVDLEVLARDWGGLTGPLRHRLKRALLSEIARTARALHEGGLNHRDFYLGHFLVQDRHWTDWTPADPLAVYLIDLHRVQMRAEVPRRWRVKDLGGLLFSALDAGLTRRDLLRFAALYRGRPWRESLVSDRVLWRQVGRNAARLYQRLRGRPAPANLRLG
ncbi:MAG: hypothetical protein RJA22_1038 [Verrucomicrobiota bacterium]